MNEDGLALIAQSPSAPKIVTTENASHRTRANANSGIVSGEIIESEVECHNFRRQMEIHR